MAGKQRTHYEIDMCNGPILSKMLRFSIPLMCSSVLQLLFNAADIVVTEEAARFVAGLPLKGVGEDSISLDPCDTVDYPNHLTLFSAGLVNTENLKGLAQLIGWEFTFLTMPLKFENADGCSCRAAAIVTKEA